MDLKKCPYCGEELPQEMNFCLYCMNKLNEEEKATIPKEKYIRRKFYMLIGACILVISAVIIVNLPHNPINTSIYDNSSLLQGEGEPINSPVPISATIVSPTPSQTVPPIQVRTSGTADKSSSPPIQSLTTGEFLNNLNISKSKTGVSNFNTEWSFESISVKQTRAKSVLYCGVNPKSPYYPDMFFDYFNDGSKFKCVIEGLLEIDKSEAIDFYQLALKSFTKQYDSYEFQNFITDDRTYPFKVCDYQYKDHVSNDNSRIERMLNDDKNAKKVEVQSEYKKGVVDGFECTFEVRKRKYYLNITANFSYTYYDFMLFAKKQ